MSLLIAGACAPPRRPFVLPPGMVATPALAHHVHLEETFDMRLGKPLEPADIKARLGEARLVFLGEQHTDTRSHAFQLEILTLLRDSGRSPAVTLEMFPPSANAALEDWRMGRLGELEFLERSQWYKHWRFPWSYYRELFLWFREHQVPLRGVNAELENRVKVREDRLEQLPEDVAEELAGLEIPENRLPPYDAYLLNVLNAGGHGGSMKLESPAFQEKSRVQRMWDRLMGQRTTRWALSRPADTVTVLLIGSGHLAHRLGADLQAARLARLPLLTVWDTVASPARLDSEGHFRVPLGMADWVRIYPLQDDPPAYPNLLDWKLIKAEKGVMVEVLKADKDEAKSPEIKKVLPALQAGDVILALNDDPATSPAALRWAYEQLPFGKAASLRVLREGKEITLDATPKRKSE